MTTLEEQKEILLYRLFKDVRSNSRNVPNPDDFIIENNGQPTFDYKNYMNAYYRVQDGEFAKNEMERLSTKIANCRLCESREDEMKYRDELANFLSLNVKGQSVCEDADNKQEEIRYYERLLRHCEDIGDNDSAEIMKQNIKDLHETP